KAPSLFVQTPAFLCKMGFLCKASPAKKRREDRAGAVAGASGRESTGRRQDAPARAGGEPAGDLRGRVMKRTDVTYGQLDGALRSLGFSCRLVTEEPPARVYEHESGALIVLPSFPEKDRVLDYHLVAVRTTLDNYGIADPMAFAAELQ